MNSQQRRARRRLIASLREHFIVKEPSQPHKVHKESKPHQSQARQYFGKTISRTKLLWSLVLGGLAFLGGYALLRPHISVEPGIVLNPGDPFSTQFDAMNDSLIFDVTEIKPSCYTLLVQTTNNVELRGLPARPLPMIPTLGPRDKTTITCPPFIGGLGAGSGNV